MSRHEISFYGKAAAVHVSHAGQDGYTLTLDDNVDSVTLELGWDLLCEIARVLSCQSPPHESLFERLRAGFTVRPEPSEQELLMERARRGYAVEPTEHELRGDHFDALDQTLTPAEAATQFEGDAF